MNKAQQILIELDEFDSSDIFIPKGNLGIERRDMPQVEEKNLVEFVKWLKAQGVAVKLGKVSAKTLKPIQKEIRSDQVKDMAAKDSPKLKKPVLIAKKDNYIIDGHHRWLGRLEQDKNADVDAYQIDMKIKDFLNLAMKSSLVVYKDTSNKVYDQPLVKRY